MSAIVATGDGNAGEFVRAAAAELGQELPFTPHHGTLNLAGRRRDIVKDLPHAFVADVGDDDYCTGTELYACRIDGVLASVIVPEVPGYSTDKVELLAPVHLRTLFGLADGDAVRLDPPETLVDPAAHRVNPNDLDSFGAVVFDFEGTLVASETDELGGRNRMESATPLANYLSGLDCPVGVCTRGPASATEDALERFRDGWAVDAVVGQESDGGEDERLTLEQILRCLDKLDVEPGAVAFVTPDRDAALDAASAPFSVLDANAVADGR